LLDTEPPAVADEIEELEKMKPQDEDSQGVTEEREGDIYADAVLSCSIENKEECMMCSG
jgi:ribonucleoside-diphosphate reductase subunit M1